MKIWAVNLFTCLAVLLAGCRAEDAAIPIKPHASWVFGKVSMVIDNGEEAHVFVIPISRYPEEKPLLDVVIPKDKKAEFNPFPSQNDLIVACGNARGDSYMIEFRTVSSWQVWNGKTALDVFGANPITGTVIRSGELKAGGELIYLDTGNGTTAEAYIAPGLEGMYSKLPKSGEKVTISGPRFEGMPRPTINVACPIQIMGGSLVINDSEKASQ